MHILSAIKNMAPEDFLISPPSLLRKFNLFDTIDSEVCYEKPFY